VTARTVEGVAGGRRVVLAVAGGNFTQLGARLLLSPVVPLVLVEFDATKTSVGLALTGMWAVYALLQFPSGVLADRYGEYRLVLAGLVGTAVGAVLVATAPSLLAYGLFALVLGAGGGLFFSPASSLLSRLFDAQGEALGSLTAGGSVAGVAFPAVASFVAVRFGWRPAVALGALVAVPVAVVTVRSVPRLPPVTPDRRLRSVLDAGLILDLRSAGRALLDPAGGPPRVHVPGVLLVLPDVPRRVPRAGDRHRGARVRGRVRALGARPARRRPDLRPCLA